tara:strand:- start:150 stop:359 length:210 start_codon:yes stop_codon:yes gene_type:complete
MEGPTAVNSEVVNAWEEYIDADIVDMMRLARNLGEVVHKIYGPQAFFNSREDHITIWPSNDVELVHHRA